MAGLGSNCLLRPERWPQMRVAAESLAMLLTSRRPAPRLSSVRARPGPRESPQVRGLLRPSGLRLQRVRRASASKIAVSEAALGDLCGLDGVEADGVAQTVSVAGDTS